MVQLQVLSGKKAGAEWVARHFPFLVGRAADNHFSIEDEGVWDRHLEIAIRTGEGFLLRTHPDALTSVNGHPINETWLRNGDLIRIGSVQIRFWLVPARQYSLRFREAVTWLTVALLCASQIALIYWLLD